jgi:amino acid transporter
MVTGVYVPTLLTILGVIMYLRLGWVVGSVGLAGCWLIIAIAFTITTTTTLSMASIISNIRIGPGGAFSIITRSLGIEIGGSIGVPFYIAMAFSVVLYIFGFREGFLMLFPSVPSLLVDLIIFVIVFGIVFFSTDIAFRLQYLIVAIMIASLISIVGAGMTSVPSFEFSTVSSETSLPCRA